MSNDEKYVDMREQVMKMIDRFLEQGETCGFTKDQVVEDILEHLSEHHNISCTQD
jgi:hypothetical protein